MGYTNKRTKFKITAAIQKESSQVSTTGPQAVKQEI
jgi:hypothetical protein